MIELRNVQKVLGGKTVLDIPELAVGAGETAGVFGLEDSGRDALFALLIGRIRPTLGTVRLGGADPAQSRERFSRLSGIVFTEDALYKNLSARANLEFQADLFGTPKARIDEVLAQVGLADQESVSAGKLPPGLQRRLAFGRAVLHRPKALVLEELFARCDEATIMLLESLVRAEAESGTAVLLLSSTSARLAPLCFRIYNLQQGRLLETKFESEDAGRRAFKLPVKLEDKVVLLNPVEILYADAGEGRISLVTPEGRLPTQYTLADLENKLSRSGFFRAHRSILVNLQHVKEVIPYTRNSYSIRLDDAAGTKIPLSKSAAAELKAFFGY
ncbi:MAG: LytTR family transcriptional regulator DNA-binding domain-containing protein [Anaerolineales bacterium]|nr:LytTR family transcriptional regulator DNA-binding domain-containing protein [Anaerolineales bacterium]